MIILFQFTILFFTLFLSTKSATIYPDPQNPILMQFPNREVTGNLIIIRFRLASDSLGLTTSQFIGVKFPSTMSSQLGLIRPMTEQNFNRFSCKLDDKDGNTYPMTPRPSNEFENTFFCRYDDTQRNLVPNGEYTLTITLSAINLSTSGLIRLIGIFTSTTNSKDKIIIDSNPTFGDLASFSEPNNQAISLFNITESVISTGTAQISSTFDITLSIKLGWFFDPALHIFLLKLPADTVTRAPTSITSERGSATDTGELASPLAGSFGLEPFGATPFFFNITGIIDTKLILGRYFKLVFRGITVNDFIPPPVSATAAERYLELIVMDRNSYTVASFSRALLTNFRSITITSFTVDHPQGVENIYSGASWPFRFTFSSPRAFINGGYVVIRQTDTILSQRRINFISSTCDFTANVQATTGIADTLGSRPICFPVRNDFNYAFASTSNQFEGSGFAFRLPVINMNVPYTVTIFAYAENCGLSPSLVGKDMFTTFKFGLKVHRSMNMNFFHEDRFNGKGSVVVNLFADSKVTTSTHKCWPAYNGNGQILDDSVAYVSNDLIILKEITDFRLGIMTANKVSTCTNCFFNDMKDPLNTVWNDGALYNTANSLSGSYFALRFDFKLSDSPVLTYYPRNVIPNFIFGVGGGSAMAGKVKLDLQPSYFVAGDTTNCYLSWGLAGYVISGSTINFKSVSQTTLLNVNTDDSTPKIGYTNVLTGAWIPTLNIVTQGGGTLNGLDAGFPKVSSTEVSIRSVIDPIGNQSFRFLQDGAKAAGTSMQYYTLGLYTNCAKYTTTIPTFTSPFNYFEARLEYINLINNLDVVNRSIRFFKFVTDLGIIDKSKFFQAAVGITFHTANFSNLVNSNLIFPSLYNNAICLIQINTKDLFDSIDTSNVLLVYMNNLMLLDVDYTNLSSTYPISPQIDAYSFNSNAFTLGIHPSTVNVAMSPTTINYYHNYMFNHYPIRPRTIALNFLGPVLHINFGQTLKNSFTSDILIPTFCPLLSGVSSSTPKIPTNPFYSPSVTLMWNTSTNRNFRINTIDRLVAPPVAAGDYGYYMPPFDVTYRPIPGAAEFPVYSSVRFAAYSSADSSKLFFIGNPPTQVRATPPALANNYQCSGFAYFFTSFFTISNTFSLFVKVANVSPAPSNINTSIYKKPENPFYIFGKPFTHFAGFALATPQTIVNSGFQNYIQGITRPSLESFITRSGTRTYLDAINKLAFYCQSSGSSNADSTYFTNFVSSLTPTSTIEEVIGSFLIDWAPDNLSEWSKLSIGHDKEKQPAFKDDYAGNFKITFSLPSGSYLIPFVTAIRVQNTVNKFFNKNTVCAMRDSNSNFSVNCDLTDSSNLNSFDCLAITQSSDFTICCYNAFTGITNTIPFPKVSLIYLPNHPNVQNLPTNSWSEGATIPNSARISYAINNSGLRDLINDAGVNNAALVEEISYSYIQQANAYVKANFKISLPREAVPGSYLRIIENGANFRSFIINGFPPRCSVRMSPPDKVYSNDYGDFMVGNCSWGDGEFRIDFKPLIRRCGLTLTSVINISFWPVRAVSFLDKMMLFSIEMRLSGNDENIAKSNQMYPAVYKGSVPLQTSPKPRYVDTSGTMITPVRVFPRVIGEYGDHTFSVSLGMIEDADKPPYAPNEIITYFPHEFFNIEDNYLNRQILCYWGLTDAVPKIVPCRLIDVNVLQITFSFGLDYKTPFFFMISGVQNSQTDTDFPFLFSINYVDKITGIRTFIVNGSTKMFHVSEPISPANFGPLRIIRNEFQTNTPKIFTTRDKPFFLRIAFDTTSSIPSTVILPNIPNNPILVISFPYPEFQYLYMPNLQIQARVMVIVYDSLGNYYSGNNIFENATVRGNKIRIPLTSSLSMTNFLYFDVSLINMPTVLDPIALTPRIKATFLNNEAAVVFRCYSNNYIVSTEQMEKRIDSYITHNRGFKFVYKTIDKYILDVVLCGDRWNEIKLKSGMTTTCFLRLRNVNYVLSSRPHFFTQLSLADPYGLFNIQNDVIPFPSILLNVPFRIGVSCDAPTGIYFINFNMTDTVNFYHIPPILVFVEKFAPGTILIPTIPNVPDFGRLGFSLTLSEPTSSNLTFRFYGEDYNENDPSVSISNLNIPAFSQTGLAFIEVSSRNVSANLKLNVVSNSGCFAPNGYLFSFNVAGKNADFPNNFNETAAFSEFINGDTNLILKNQFQYKFKPPFVPSIMHCVFLCLNKKFPSNDDLIRKNFIEGPLYNYTYFQFFNTDQITVRLHNLVRGKSYKMKCLMQSTESDPSQRKNRTAIFNFLPGTQTEIKTSQKIAINFVEYYFSTFPGAEALKSLLTFCQNKFIYNSTEQSTNPACMYCVDGDGMALAGLNLTSDDVTNCQEHSAIVNRRLLSSKDEDNHEHLRFLQNSTSNFENPDDKNKNKNVSTAMYYRLYLIQDSLCSSNMIEGQEVTVKISELIKSLMDKKLLETINKNLSDFLGNMTHRSEDRAPIVNLSLSNYNFSSSGFFNFTVANVVTNDSNYLINCYWGFILNNSALPPSFDEIEGCTNELWCGYETIQTNGTVITSSQTRLHPFPKGYVYSLWMACYNFIPYATIRANVTLLANYDLRLVDITSVFTNKTKIPDPVPFLNFSNNELNLNKSSDSTTFYEPQMKEMLRKIFYLVLMIVILL